MELLDRYLQAVGKHLPWDRRDDIIAELRANLESQLEEREGELHRQLTPAEAEEWIQKLGSPVLMAARYQPQQYLIGPAIFPMYLYVLRLASMWAIIIYTIVSTVTIILGSASGAAVAEAAMRLPFVLIQVAAWVTVVFAAIEFTAARCPGTLPAVARLGSNWSPANLPALEPAAAPGKKRRSYAQAVTEVIFGFLFLGWLLLVPEHPFLMFGPGVAFLHASPFHVAPVWLTFYWWVVGLNAIQLAWKCVDLLRGAWQKRDRLQNIVVSGFGLIPLVLLATVRDQAYLLLRHPETDRVQYGPTVDSINHWTHLSVELLCVMVAIQLAWEIARAIFESRRAVPAAR